MIKMRVNHDVVSPVSSIITNSAFSHSLKLCLQMVLSISFMEINENCPILYPRILLKVVINKKNFLRCSFTKNETK